MKHKNLQKLTDSSTHNESAEINKDSNGKSPEYNNSRGSEYHMRPLTVCMYGAAADNIDFIYFREAEAFGRAIARQGYSMIYGGGGSGLMGAAARGVRAEGGKITGVVPDFMKDYEDIFNDCTEMIHTKTMAERKYIMEKRADAFVITPGGIGTFDEFFQIVALSTLDRYSKPIILFNINGYYNTLLKAIDEAQTKGFMHKNINDYVTVAETVEDIMKALKEADR